MVNLPPTGDNLQTFEKVSLSILTSITWLVGLSLAWYISNPTNPCIGVVLRIPLVSGIVGLATIVLSFLLVPIFIPRGEIGRWDESFEENFTSISVLVYYSPFRVLIPTGFSIACLGLLISVANTLQREKIYVHRFLKVVLALATLFASLGSVGCLIFSRHIDFMLHIRFFSMMFAGWAILPCLGSLTMRGHHFFAPLISCSYIVFMLSILYIFAYNSPVMSEGLLAILEHGVYCTQFIWLILFGRTLQLDLNQIVKEYEEQETILTMDDCPLKESDSSIEEQQLNYSQIRTAVIVYTLLFIMNAATMQNVAIPNGPMKTMDPNSTSNYKSPTNNYRTRHTHNSKHKHHSSGQKLLGPF